MMMSAEQDPVGKVGAPVVASPLPDVVSLGPRWRPIASRPHASAVAHGQCSSLASGVGALFPPEVEHLAGCIEDHGQDAARTGETFDGCHRRRLAALENA